MFANSKNLFLMAKQRGIHQIKGKINNLCYYEQKYVRGGLIRRINEAMSERLKTDPVFANTRTANSIFGGCSQFASVILSFFGNRNTYLFKPYRQALLTAAVKKYLLENSSISIFPTILGSPILYNFFPKVIDLIIKNPIRIYFPELEIRVSGLSMSDTYEFEFSFDRLTSFCQKNKCIGVQLTVSPAYYLYPSSYESSLGKYFIPENNAGGRGSYINWYLSESDSSAIVNAYTGETDDTLTFWVVYALPILSTLGGRPIMGKTGASCGVVLFKAS